MNIICDHNFRNLIKDLPQFEVDLGKSYTTKDDKGFLKSKIKDEFILNVLRQEKAIIYKIAVLGPISIYTYGFLPKNQIWIYKDTHSEKHIHMFDEELATFNIEKYLANMLWEIVGK